MAPEVPTEDLCVPSTTSTSRWTLSFPERGEGSSAACRVSEQRRWVAMCRVHRMLGFPESPWRGSTQVQLTPQTGADAPQRDRSLEPRILEQAIGPAALSGDSK